MQNLSHIMWFLGFGVFHHNQVLVRSQIICLDKQSDTCQKHYSSVLSCVQCTRCWIAVARSARHRGHSRSSDLSLATLLTTVDRKELASAQKCTRSAAASMSTKSNAGGCNRCIVHVQSKQQSRIQARHSCGNSLLHFTECRVYCKDYVAILVEIFQDVSKFKTFA